MFDLYFLASKLLPKVLNGLRDLSKYYVFICYQLMLLFTRHEIVAGEIFLLYKTNAFKERSNMKSCQDLQCVLAHNTHVLN